MTYFVKDPDEMTEEALRKAEYAGNILKMAEENYDKDPSKANELSLKAALRLCQDTQAEAEEWII